MKLQNILLFFSIIACQLYLQASNAFNNDATYYLDRTDDFKPVGMHPQKDDLDVSIANNSLLQAAFLGNLRKVENVLRTENNISDKDIADALYYATTKRFDKIVDLLSEYAFRHGIRVDYQFVDNQ